jgi:hypothetical protein
MKRLSIMMMIKVDEKVNFIRELDGRKISGE